MTDLYRAAVVQTNSDGNKQANVDTALKLIEEAARGGAQLIALPEMFPSIGPPETIVASAERVPGPLSDKLAATARRLGVMLLAGSMAETSDREDRVYNTSLLFSPEGELLATYRKLHLFDVDLPGRVTVKESAWTVPGEQIVTTPTDLGVLGQAICYDLRFPELFRLLADEGADVLLIPSAFTHVTGCDHWQVLLRARAIENQAYVIAPNQYGRHTPKLTSYGRSTIIDPWGIPLAVAPDGVGVSYATIDRARIEDVRSHLPSLAHRRDLSRFATSG